MKRKRTRQQIIKDIFSIPEVAKVNRELQKTEPKIDNVPHAWTPKDGVIYDFVEAPKKGLDVFLENKLMQTLYKEDVVGADIGEDNFGPPYPSQIRAVNGRAIGLDGYIAPTVTAPIKSLSWWKKFWNKIRRIHVSK